MELPEMCRLKAGSASVDGHSAENILKSATRSMPKEMRLKKAEIRDAAKEDVNTAADTIQLERVEWRMYRRT